MKKFSWKNFFVSCACAGFLMLSASACSLLSPDDGPTYEQTGNEGGIEENG